MNKNMKKKIIKQLELATTKGLYCNHDAEKICNNCLGRVTGNISPELTGNISGLFGDITGIERDAEEIVNILRKKEELK